MRFLSIYKSVESDLPPGPDQIVRMTKLVEEGMKAGRWRRRVRAAPDLHAGRVRRSGLDIATDVRAQFAAN